MKMTRPHFFFSMPGRKWRERRTPLSTFTSKKRSQSESGISRKGLASKIPKLLTTMSASGIFFRKASTPARVPRSPATPRNCAPATRLAIFFFFQAEDGIRDLYVTGVQTCALPIFLRALDTVRQKGCAVEDEES